ncbi:MAG: tripartite tricarboxylate transporter substrate binding protein [Betaproteobacteria bacterium]
MNTQNLLQAVCAGALFFTSVAGAATPAYPEKPIRMLLPYPPGGNTDILARSVAARMTESWDTPVVVDARGGGNGIIATEIAAKSAPDGYTIFVGSTREMSVIPILTPDVPYNVARDFAPVTQGTITPILLAVHPSFPAKSVKDIVDYAKANPGALLYGTPGVGTSMHLSGELLNMLAGVKTVHVAYKGGGPAVLAVMAGQEVKFGYVGMGPAIPHVKSGRMRPLALTTSTRSPLLPDVPTMMESGYQDFDTSIWFAFFVPAKTPKNIIAKINTELNRILRSKEVNDFLVGTGVIVAPGTAEALGLDVKNDAVRYGKIIKAANIKVD